MPRKVGRACAVVDATRSVRIIDGGPLAGTSIARFTRMQAHSLATQSTDSVFSRVRDFIARNFYVPDPSKISGDASLVDGGILDSTGVLELAAFLESEFGIKIADAELLPANLDTIDRVVDFVGRKHAPRRD